VSDTWIKQASVSYQSQRLEELLGAEDHHYNVWHEPTGIVLMYRKPPGEEGVSWPTGCGSKFQKILHTKQNRQTGTVRERVDRETS